jgi:hypothetical protein
MRTYNEWSETRHRTAGDFLKTFPNQQVQVHLLQALMTHETYRGKSAFEILELPISPQLERDVQEHLGLKV